jgi:hypothetical protein
VAVLNMAVGMMWNALDGDNFSVMNKGKMRSVGKEGIYMLRSRRFERSKDQMRCNP